uniref:NADH-ubiquinone oxidoreductase chain 2 n=1 Tax=Pneumocystis canis TaxID=2698477 RepID=A0A8A6W5L9_9ASCO|nr:NADH dehydrogenase subunit 2 [Pneumocystis canis]QTK22339.1 NADH dehydrogenase subunit 2 [Pneumocystis canis]QTK22369.1 NADH dehydrogenase subunit 2 [Pneumocystis canis]
MLLISTLVQLLTITFFPQRWNLILLSRIVMISLFYSILLSYNSYYYKYLGNGIGIYAGTFQATNLTHFGDIFVCLLGILILGITGFYCFNKRGSTKKILSTLEYKQPLEYPLLIQFFLIGSQLLMGSLNIISIYISIELQSFSLYLLTSLNSSSSKIGLKYFLLGTLSSCFILLGLGLMYSYSGITSLESLFIFYQVNPTNIIMNSGLLIFLSGLLFKIAVVPFQQGAVYIYDGVPTLITTWLSTLTKIPILIILIDFIYYCYESWISILVLACFLSMIVGSVLGLYQVRIKRLLVYSMISHVGFLLLSLCVCSKNSLQAFFLYIIQYSLTNLNIFLILIAMGYYLKKVDSPESPVTYLKSLKGFFFINPFLSICLAVSLLSLGGIPPLVGFFAKFNVLYSILSEGYLFIAFTAIITSVISMGYYLKVIQSMFFNKPELEYEEDIIISSYLILVISFLTLCLLFYIFYPDIFSNLISLLISNYFDYSINN